MNDDERRASDRSFRRFWPALFLGATLALILLIALSIMRPAPNQSSGNVPPSGPEAAGSSFAYTFSAPGVLQEAGSMEESTSPYWWVSSGGELIIQNGVGETMQGEASSSNPWRAAYAASNPTDTDDGAHPQNLFRLVSRSEWDDVVESLSFKIVADNFSASPNRNQSNGLLLMSRYESSETLYYAGIRVDGTAVIKKKVNGVYYTLAQKQIFPGEYAIDATSGAQSENLLPHGEWIGLKDETITNPGGSVTIMFSMQLPGGDWQEILSATDSGGANVGNTAPITGPHYLGVRTDFMDVQFENFQAQEIES